VTLDAANAATGDTLAELQARADSKEQVLKALDQSTTQLREKLGESLASIKKFDKPLEEATTSSLEALKAFTLGDEKHSTEMIWQPCRFTSRLWIWIRISLWLTPGWVPSTSTTVNWRQRKPTVKRHSN